MAAKSHVAVDVAAVLDAARPAATLTTEVVKDSPLDVDLGHFTVYDAVPLDEQGGLSDERIQAITRENAQLFVNALFSLPVRTGAEDQRLGVIVDVPKGKAVLPREKPLPKPKPLTRWEKFAKEKGIVKRKRSRMVFDEQAQDYRPRFGYQRANDDQKDWLIEVPKNADMFEDQFAKRREDKKARIAKNKANQIKNLERTAAQRIMATLPVPKDAPGKNPLRPVRKVELDRALLATKASTASMGRFDRAIKNEPKVKLPTGRKRHFAPTTAALPDERSRVAALADSVLRRVANGEPLSTPRRQQQRKKGKAATTE